MRLLASLLLVSCVACGAAVDAADTVTEAKTAILHGTWRDERGTKRLATIHVEQRALSAEITVSLEGHSCLARSTLKSELTFEGVETDADVAGMRLKLKGSPGLDDMFGNFEELSDGPCEKGWLDVAR